MVFILRLNLSNNRAKMPAVRISPDDEGMEAEESQNVCTVMSRVAKS